MRLGALGFFASAAGLFVIPHDAGPLRLLRAAITASAEEHVRAAIGVSMIAVGLGLGIAGTLSSFDRGAKGRGDNSAEDVV
jgi:hypothetical protein